MEPTNGVETVKTYGEVTNGVSYPLPQELAVEEVSDNFSHDGRFVQYCINGIIFEVTAKYKSLAILTGRGAFGIAWYVISYNIFFNFRIVSFFSNNFELLSCRRLLNGYFFL